MRYYPSTFRASVRQQALLLLAVVVLLVAGAITSFEPRKAVAATSSTINFQARLMTGAGGIVPDGYYNVEFKIYSQSSGGTAAWTETYYDSNGATAGNDNRVRVANGYLTVNLGSLTAFGSINWDQEFWISMNVGGSTQTATPTWDGEMSPRLKLTAVPYAFRAGQLALQTGANTSTLGFATQNAANNILLPDEGGTLCIRNSSQCGFVTGSATNFIQNTTTLQTNANYIIQSAADGSTTGVVRSRASQTADLMQFQSSSGGIVAGVRPSGAIYSAPITDPSTDVPSNARLFVQPLSAASTAIIARAAATTPVTGDIVKLQNSDGSSDLVRIDSDGDFISSASITGVGVNAGSGLLQGTGGLTLTGAVSINNNNNSNTSINTGTSTGSVSIGNSAAGALTLASGAASSIAVTGSTLALSGTNFSLNTSGVLSLVGGQTRDVTTPNATTATALTIQPGSTSASNGTGAAVSLVGGEETSNTCGTACAGGNVVLQGGNATGSSGVRNGGNVVIDAGVGNSNNGDIDIGVNTSADVTIGRTTGGATTTIQAGNIVVLQSSGSSSVGRVQIGAGVAGANSTPDYLALDVKSDTGDPAGGDEGYMYYNTADNKFRCYQNTGWVDCINTAAGGVTTIGTIDSQAKSTNGAVITGTSLVLQHADTSFPGLVSTSAQSFAGDKTFTGTLTVTPTANSVTSLTVNATSGTAATAAIINQSQGADGLNVNVTGGSQTNGILVDRTSAGTLTNGIQISNTSGTITNGLSFSGTIGTDINRASGILSLQGAGGVTVTAGGANSLVLNTAGAGTVALGNTNTTTIDIGGTSGATTTIAGGNVPHTVAIAAAGTSTIQGVTIGSTGSTSTTTIQGGTGTAAGDINIGDQTTAGKIIDIGSVTNAGTGTVNIATAAGATQTIAIGGASAGSAANGTTILIQGGNTSNAVSIQSLASGTISIGTNAAGTVTLGNVSGTVKLNSLGSATTNAASVCRDTSTTDLIACDANTTGRPFLQGGNTFGATGVLGTNDSNSLQFETNNVVRATFDTSNALYLGLGLTAASPTNFTVAATGSATAGTAGANLTLQGGAGASATTGSAGGNIIIAGGNAGGSGNNAGGTVTLQGGLDSNSGAPGAVLVKNSADSATAFSVQNAAGTSTIFDVDTSNGRVGIGTAAPARTLDIATNSSATTPAIRLSQAGTGDTSIELAAPSTQFYVGVDGSDNTFKISSYAANAGTVNAGYNNDNPATASQDHGNPGLAVGTKVSSTSAGTLSSISIYIGSVTLGSHVKVGLYADNGTGLAPGNLIATSAEITPTPNSWNSIPVSASISASTTYWLVYRSDDAVTGATRYNTTGNMAYVSVSYASAWPNPFGTATTNTNLHYLMYMTYAVSASVDPFGVGLVRVGDTGQTAFQNSVNTTTAFRVQNAAGTSIFGIDTSNGRVGINTEAPTADLSFGAGADRTINVLAQPTAATAGNNLTINSGQGNTTGTGGILTMQAGQGGATGAGGAAVLQGGSGGSTSGAGGAVTVRGGTASGATTGGLATVVGGTAAAVAGSGGGAVAITGAAGSTTSTGGVGGAITLQGGNAGGSGNNTGGAISLTAGNSTGTTVGGGISLQAGTGGSSANGGTIGITGGTGGAATRLGGAVSITGGTGVTTGAGGALTLQGGTGGNAATGGAITVQGGSAGGGNTNGANVNLVGGVGAGTGVKGLVVVDTATFSTATTQSSATSASITQANIDSFGAIVLNATATGVTFTLSDPTLGVSAAGRLVYVIAANGTNDFTLRANTGEGTGIEQNISMRQNTTATMIWTGTNWTAAGASSSTTLQSAYDSTLTSAGGAELVLNAPGGNADGLTIRNNGTTPITGGILEVQSSIGTNLFSVNNFGTELANNGGAETAGGTSTTFPANTWTAGPVSATISRTVTAGNFVTGQAGVQVATTTTANSGVRNNLTGNPVNTIGAEYQVSFTAKSTVNGTPIDVQYSRNGGTNVVACTDYGGVQTLSNTVWTKITCTITIDSATAATDPDLIIRKTDTSSPTIYIDNLSFIRNDTTTQPSNVQVGGGINGGQITLFTLDRSSAPPVANGDTTYLGSMYYDTTTGRIQCYESDGWGACGSAPDNIISLTPEYPGAVLNGTGIGTMTADFCANQAGISFQVNSSFCASGLSRQYYRWTSPQATEQTYSIYVSYKLPNTFKEFASNSTITLTALTDSTTNGSVTYEVFRSTGSAITRCYDGVTNETAVTSSNNTWQTVGINGSEQSGCGFAGGDNVIFKINMKARSNANVYVENLNFTYLNQ